MGRGDKENQMELALLTVPSNNEDQDLLDKAQSAYDDEEYNAAKDYCERVLRSDRFHPNAKHLLGKIAIRQQEYVKAAGYFEAIRNLPYAQDNHQFSYNCESLAKCSISAIMGLHEKIEKMPQKTVEECDHVRKILDDITLLAGVAAKFGQEVSKNIAEKHTKLSQKNHYASAAAKYLYLTKEFPEVKNASCQTMTESELTNHLIKIKQLLDLMIDFITHERGMTEEDLIKFDPRSEKHAAVIKDQTLLEFLTTSTDAELTYRICLRECDSIHVATATDSKIARGYLTRFERMAKALQQQPDWHTNSRKLLSDVNEKIIPLKQTILEHNVKELAAHSYRKSVGYFDVPTPEKRRIQETLIVTFKNAQISESILNTQPQEIEHKAESVAQTLTHYYSHKKFLGCCVTNTLQLEDNFETQFENEVVNAYRQPK